MAGIFIVFLAGLKPVLPDPWLVGFIACDNENRYRFDLT